MVPKQFLLLAGMPVVMHSLQAFHHAFPGISLVLALPRNQFGLWTGLCDQHGFTIPCTLVAGGDTRFHSVQQALAAVDNDGLAAVHDSARPLVSVSLIRSVFTLAEIHGNCVPVIPVNESIREIREGRSIPVDRNSLRTVQTPQVFHIRQLKEAYRQTFREQFTDDATVVESTGAAIFLAEGDPVNIKITHLHDLAMAEIILEKQSR